MANQRLPKDVLLDISTLAPEAQHVRIDGVKYAISRQDDFGIKQQARLGSWATRAERIKMSETMTDDDADKYVTLLRDFAKTVLPDMPKNVLMKLKDQHLQGIAVVFMDASGIQIAKRPMAKPKRTGKK